MAKSTTCIFDDKEITVDKAIEIRESIRLREKKSLIFKCTECGKRVRPHKAGGNIAAHFEHLERNANCTLSDPAR